MSAGWVNLIVLVAILTIVTRFVTIVLRGAARRGGKPKPGLAKPPSSPAWKINPKTGSMYQRPTAGP